MLKKSDAVIYAKMDAVIYAKICVKCVNSSLWSSALTTLAGRGLTVAFKRTAYRPWWHIEATELWGSETYPPFVHILETGEIIALAKLEGWASGAKSKPVKIGKKKGDNNGLSGLPKTARRRRAVRVGGAVAPSAVKNEKEA